MSTYVEERAAGDRRRERGRLGPVTQSVRGLSDRELLLRGRRAKIAEAGANGQRWLMLVEFYRRRLATEQQRRDVTEHFALTARQETVVEAGSLWGVDAPRLRRELNVALYLAQHGQDVWDLCAGGRLDGYRAMLIADAARVRLSTPDEIAAFMVRITRFLQRHLEGIDGDADDEPMVACTVRQLRNKIAYELRRLRASDAEAEFRHAYAGRSAEMRETMPGMAVLGIENRLDKVRLADHRLTLAARHLRGQGDGRTVAQLKADLALDLIIGTHKTAPVPGYARPVVNLTVPIQTVMGLADEPGVLSGGSVVPAGLARMIAAEPGGSWHRMLTDPVGHLVEHSTRVYRPTGPIWRRVVAEHATCFRPGCDAPSTEGDLDHRVAWPLGPTDTTNLMPGCRTDHRAKHAPGFNIEQTGNGSYALSTAAGFRHPIRSTTHPASDDFTVPELEPEEEVDGFQFSATELLEAIEYLREADYDRHPFPVEVMWENNNYEPMGCPRNNALVRLPGQADPPI